MNANDQSEEPRNQLEATQLHNYDYEISTSSDEPCNTDTPTLPPESWFGTQTRLIATFWRRQVVATVRHDACRDHFALERTFLGYLRTSLALSFAAVIIAQFFRLEHTATPDTILGFFVLGIPLACVFLMAAIVVLLLGFYRFWKQQNAMLRGKVYAGGWEINAIGSTIFFVILTLFVLSIAVDVRKNAENS